MTLVETRDLRTDFVLGGGFFGRLVGRDGAVVTAVDGVSLSIDQGEIFGVVGESGSGKTTLGRSILRLIEVAGGQVLFQGVDITHLSESRMRPFRKQMQIVFQDPHAALNPAMTVGQAVAHPLRIHGIGSPDDSRRRVVEMLERVGLHPAERFLDSYPADMSGGQKQRAVIARALIVGPDFVVADEPVSMLDMSVRAKILSLLLDLQKEFHLTYLYITHDLATAKFVCNRLAIMYLGQVIEEGPASEIYSEPRHPYTRALLSAIPKPDPQQRGPRELPHGEVPDAADPPANCRFHPRCPRAFAPCGFEGKDLIAAIEERWTRISEEEFELERVDLGDATAMRADGYRLIVPSKGQSTKDRLELLVAEDPHPAFRNVTSVESEGSKIVVQLRQGVDPVLVKVGGAEVACHLYPPPEDSTQR